LTVIYANGEKLDTRYVIKLLNGENIVSWIVHKRIKQ